MGRVTEVPAEAMPFLLLLASERRRILEERRGRNTE